MSLSVYKRERFAYVKGLIFRGDAVSDASDVPAQWVIGAKMTYPTSIRRHHVAWTLVYISRKRRKSWT